VTPKVAKRGRSFKGAAAYYLHDKGADTSDRVAFCVTRNLPTDVPEKAWRLMAYTDGHAGILKHHAGAARTGPKRRKPVYTLSLSWHADDKPEPELMVRMMDSALKKIGLDRCQSLYVAHSDTDHPHIHALVNLVDPDNGKIIDPGKDHEKLSRWAQSYETEKGVIRCQRRVENNARRDRGEWVVDRHSKTRQDIEQARLIEREILRGRREQLWARQVADREALKAQAKQRAEAIGAELKQRFRPEWAAFFRRQRQDARDVANARRSVLAAMRVAIKERRRLTPDGRPGISTILAYSVSAKALGDALAAAEQRELAVLRGRMNEVRKVAVQAVWASYGRDYRALREAQAKARKDPPALAPDEENRRREELAATMARQQAEKERAEKAAAERAAEQRRAALRAEYRAQAEEIARRRGDKQREAEKERDGQQQGRPPARPGQPRRDPPKRGPVRLELPEVGEAVPAQDEEARRRAALKAEFRQQAEEIARRRRERSPKDKDRDRDRER
jgi:hypothetical protein